MKFVAFLLLTVCLLITPILTLCEENVILYDSVVSNIMTDLEKNMTNPHACAYFSAIMVMDSAYALKDRGIALATPELSYVACRKGYQAVCFSASKDSSVYYLLEHGIDENTATCTILESYNPEKLTALLDEKYDGNWTTNDPKIVARYLLHAIKDVAEQK